MDLELDGDAALVTAASRGLGRASAEALARDGADVAICARNAERLEAAREAIDAAGDGAVLAVQADVTDDQGDVDGVADQVRGAFGGLDHLVVSTGGPRTVPFGETDERDWYVTYDLLVMSVVRFAKEVADDLATDGGSLTVLSCTAARAVEDDFALGNAATRASVGLVKTLAREFAPAIRANAVLAGHHDTDFFDERLAMAVERGEYDDEAEARAAIRDRIPAERIGEPSDVGDAVAFLASDRAQYVTGAALPVDGGLLRS